MNEPLLSVIIPVYNCEKSIKKCLDSIVHQTYAQLDIIIVNDGSTDNSETICESYKVVDSRIRIFKIKNSGSYQARRYGAQHAKGKIVTFLDADDYLDKCAYEELMRIYVMYVPDIILYTFQIDNSGKACENNFECGLYDRPAILNEIIPKMMFDIRKGSRALNPSVGCKVIKKKLFLDVTDTKERITWGDDALVTYPLMCIAHKIYIDSHPYYHYVMNDESSTHKFQYGIIDDLVRFRNHLSRLLNKYYAEYDWKFQIDSYIRTYGEVLFKSWFGIHRVASVYVFPFHLIPYNSNIKIYGAGEVGKSYIAEVLQSKYVKLAGWYDKKEQGNSYCGVPISNPDNLLDQEIEYIIIAIENEKIVSEVRKELVNRGINPEKIKWDVPILRA